MKNYYLIDEFSGVRVVVCACESTSGTLTIGTATLYVDDAECARATADSAHCAACKVARVIGAHVPLFGQTCKARMQVRIAEQFAR